MEKAKFKALTKVKNSDGTSTDVDGNGALLEVNFNPKELSLGRTATFEQAANKANLSELQFKGGSNMTLGMTLYYDTFETGGSVRDAMAPLEALMNMVPDPGGDSSSPTLAAPSVQSAEASAIAAATGKPAAACAAPPKPPPGSPPTVLFIWGRFRFKGVITSLTQKYTMFLSDGTPVRAEVTLAMTQTALSAADLARADPMAAASNDVTSQKLRNSGAACLATASVTDPATINPLATAAQVAAPAVPVVAAVPSPFGGGVAGLMGARTAFTGVLGSVSLVNGFAGGARGLISGNGLSLSLGAVTQKLGLGSLGGVVGGLSVGLTRNASGGLAVGVTGTGALVSPSGGSVVALQDTVVLGRSQSTPSVSSLPITTPTSPPITVTPPVTVTPPPTVTGPPPTTTPGAGGGQRPGGGTPPSTGGGDGSGSGAPGGTGGHTGGGSKTGGGGTGTTGSTGTTGGGSTGTTGGGSTGTTGGGTPSTTGSGSGATGVGGKHGGTTGTASTGTPATTGTGSGSGSGSGAGSGTGGKSVQPATSTSHSGAATPPPTATSHTTGQTTGSPEGGEKAPVTATPPSVAATPPPAATGSTTGSGEGSPVEEQPTAAKPPPTGGRRPH